MNRYSTNSGTTWSASTRAFVTAGVNRVSIWYDSSSGVVYAIGDRSAASTGITVQRGVVDTVMHTITWAASDTTVAVSTNTQGDKNSFISKDAAGYLWILASNDTGINPVRQDLSTFRSASVDSIE